ncbi:Protein of unknown function (DUF3152) [Saccharomonospora xinjiangensis XJ-54]|uniref:DUF3152 domain-containing protein n=1 Tax=Saccharomonospora xinjiangensis XJ-54 TaxID=882086 RepID=I0V0B1_9PSEU|nr:Protein of unknown function (DUF3152) [Saccharomonospora xinjiangensis XJ-54]
MSSHARSRAPGCGTLKTVERVRQGARKSDRDIASAGADRAGARGAAEGAGPDGGAEHGARPRGRRRSAEPLRASWQPAGTAPPQRAQRTGVKKYTAAFGWRAYLVPILLVVTALVVFDTTRDPGAGGAAGAAGGGQDSAGGPAEPDPVATEVPAQKIDLDIPTAELPEGGDYDEKGEGTWHSVPLGDSSGKQAGEGQLFTYTVEIEDGLDPGSYGGDDVFAATVEATLSDPRSWPGTGKVALKRVDSSHATPDFRVSLTSPSTTKQLCGAAIPFESSCYTSAHGRVVINIARWVRGAKAFSGNMGVYQQYVINHEVGHALKNGHVGCAEDGGLAPVMMQQTFGVANDYVAKLNDLPGGDQGKVPADGKVCLPNAWPVPQPGND